MLLSTADVDIEQSEHYEQHNKLLSKSKWQCNTNGCLVDGDHDITSLSV